VSVIVHDPFNVAADPKMPFLHAALEPEQAWPRLQGGCARLRNAAGQARLRSIKVVRHKPGRRCLIEYEVELMRSNRAEVLGLLGKARARGWITRRTTCCAAFGSPTLGQTVRMESPCRNRWAWCPSFKCGYRRKYRALC